MDARASSRAPAPARPSTSAATRSTLAPIAVPASPTGARRTIPASPMGTLPSRSLGERTPFGDSGRAWAGEGGVSPTSRKFRSVARVTGTFVVAGQRAADAREDAAALAAGIPFPTLDIDGDRITREDVRAQGRARLRVLKTEVEKIQQGIHQCLDDFNGTWRAGSDAKEMKRTLSASRASLTRLRRTASAGSLGSASEFDEDDLAAVTADEEDPAGLSKTATAARKREVDSFKQEVARLLNLAAADGHTRAERFHLLVESIKSLMRKYAEARKERRRQFQMERLEASAKQAARERAKLLDASLSASHSTASAAPSAAPSAEAASSASSSSSSSSSASSASSASLPAGSASATQPAPTLPPKTRLNHIFPSDMPAAEMVATITLADPRDRIALAAMTQAEREEAEEKRIKEAAVRFRRDKRAGAATASASNKPPTSASASASASASTSASTSASSSSSASLGTTAAIVTSEGLFAFPTLPTKPVPSSRASVPRDSEGHPIPPELIFEEPVRTEPVRARAHLLPRLDLASPDARRRRRKGDGARLASGGRGTASQPGSRASSARSGKTGERDAENGDGGSEAEATEFDADGVEGEERVGADVVRVRRAGGSRPVGHGGEGDEDAEDKEGEEDEDGGEFEDEEDEEDEDAMEDETVFEMSGVNPKAFGTEIQEALAQTTNARSRLQSLHDAMMDAWRDREVAMLSSLRKQLEEMDMTLRSVQSNLVLKEDEARDLAERLKVAETRARHAVRQQALAEEDKKALEERTKEARAEAEQAVARERKLQNDLRELRLELQHTSDKKKAVEKQLADLRKERTAPPAPAPSSAPAPAPAPVAAPVTTAASSATRASSRRGSVNVEDAVAKAVEAERARAEQEAAALRARLSALESQWTDARKEAQEAAAALKATREEAEFQQRELSAKVDDLRDELADARRSPPPSAAALAESAAQARALKEAQEAAAKLRADLVAAKEAASDAAQRAEARIAELQTLLNDARRDAKRQELAAADAQNAVETAHAELARAEQELTAVRAASGAGGPKVSASELSAARAQLEAVRAELDLARKESRAAEGDRATAHAERDTALAESATLREDLVHTKTALDAATAELEGLRNQVARLTQANQAAEAEADQLRLEASRSASQAATTAKEALTVTRSRLASIESHASAVEAARDALSARVAQLEAELEAARSASASAGAEGANSAGTADSADSTATALLASRSEVERLTAELARQEAAQREALAALEAVQELALAEARTAGSSAAWDEARAALSAAGKDAEEARAARSLAEEERAFERERADDLERRLVAAEARLAALLETRLSASDVDAPVETEEERLARAEAATQTALSAAASRAASRAASVGAEPTDAATVEGLREECERERTARQAAEVAGMQWKAQASDARAQLAEAQGRLGLLDATVDGLRRDLEAARAQAARAESAREAAERERDAERVATVARAETAKQIAGAGEAVAEEAEAATRAARDALAALEAALQRERADARQLRDALELERASQADVRLADTERATWEDERRRLAAEREELEHLLHTADAQRASADLERDRLRGEHRRALERATRAETGLDTLRRAYDSLNEELARRIREAKEALLAADPAGAIRVTTLATGPPAHDRPTRRLSWTYVPYLSPTARASMLDTPLEVRARGLQRIQADFSGGPDSALVGPEFLHFFPRPGSVPALASYDLVRSGSSSPVRTARPGLDASRSPSRPASAGIGRRDAAGGSGETAADTAADLALIPVGPLHADRRNAAGGITSGGAATFQQSAGRRSNASVTFAAGAWRDVDGDDASSERLAGFERALARESERTRVAEAALTSLQEEVGLLRATVALGDALGFTTSGLPTESTRSILQALELVREHVGAFQTARENERHVSFGEVLERTDALRRGALGPLQRVLQRLHRALQTPTVPTLPTRLPMASTGSGGAASVSVGAIAAGGGHEGAASGTGGAGAAVASSFASAALLSGGGSSGGGGGGSSTFSAGSSVRRGAARTPVRKTESSESVGDRAPAASRSSSTVTGAPVLSAASFLPPSTPIRAASRVPTIVTRSPTTHDDDMNEERWNPGGSSSSSSSSSNSSGGSSSSVGMTTVTAAPTTTAAATTTRTASTATGALSVSSQALRGGSGVRVSSGTSLDADSESESTLPRMFVAVRDRGGAVPGSSSIPPSSSSSSSSSSFSASLAGPLPALTASFSAPMLSRITGASSTSSAPSSMTKRSRPAIPRPDSALARDGEQGRSNGSMAQSAIVSPWFH